MEAIRKPRHRLSIRVAVPAIMLVMRSSSCAWLTDRHLWRIAILAKRHRCNLTTCQPMETRSVSSEQTTERMALNSKWSMKRKLKPVCSATCSRTPQIHIPGRLLVRMDKCYSCAWAIGSLPVRSLDDDSSDFDATIMRLPEKALPHYQRLSSLDDERTLDMFTEDGSILRFQN